MDAARPGHGKSPDGVQDFEVDAELIAGQVLDEPAHLVGLSYGAIVAMLAAARRPEMVRTLTVVEPPAAGIVRSTRSSPTRSRPRPVPTATW
ncbi:alpha/beta fold hydrolase [Amycolatopsis sp. TRM77291]